MNNILFKKVAALPMMLFVCMGCSAYPKSRHTEALSNHLDSCITQTVGDSILSIISNAKTVTCELYVKSITDSLRSDTIIVLPPKMITVLKYLYYDPVNFQSNAVIYGIYSPWVCYTIKSSKKRIVYLEMDFGLKKWRLLDAEKKKIHMADMQENNKQMLRLTRMLFPKSEQLKLLNENLK